MNNWWVTFRYGGDGVGFGYDIWTHVLAWDYRDAIAEARKKLGTLLPKRSRLVKVEDRDRWRGAGEGDR